MAVIFGGFSLLAALKPCSATLQAAHAGDNPCRKNHSTPLRFFGSSARLRDFAALCYANRRPLKAAIRFNPALFCHLARSPFSPSKRLHATPCCTLRHVFSPDTFPLASFTPGISSTEIRCPQTRPRLSGQTLFVRRLRAALSPHRQLPRPTHPFRPFKANDHPNGTLTARLGLRRRSAPLRSAVCALPSPRIGLDEVWRGVWLFGCAWLAP